MIEANKLYFYRAVGALKLERDKGAHLFGDNSQLKRIEK